MSVLKTILKIARPILTLGLSLLVKSESSKLGGAAPIVEPVAEMAIDEGLEAIDEAIDKKPKRSRKSKKK